MKSKIFCYVAFSFLFAINYGFGQSLDTTIVIQSKILNEQRTVRIGLPSEYYSSDSDYASVYVLDAEYRFDICRSMHRYFEIATRMPKSIMIGIANLSKETRNRDMLPPNFGGTDSLFRLFITEELIPYVEKHYRVNEERAIAGHSHGGVFTVNTLIHHPHIFSKYVATDPSFQIINSNLPDSLSGDLSNKSMYICSSDGLYGFGIEISSDMLTNNMIFQNYRVQNRNTGLRFYAEHVQDDHGHSFLTGFHRGMRWAFDWPISKETLKK